MAFKDEVVQPADGDFSPFKQGWYCKTDAGAILNENLATLAQPGPRAPTNTYVDTEATRDLFWELSGTNASRSGCPATAAGTGRGVDRTATGYSVKRAITAQIKQPKPAAAEAA